MNLRHCSAVASCRSHKLVSHLHRPRLPKSKWTSKRFWCRWKLRSQRFSIWFRSGGSMRRRHPKQTINYGRLKDAIKISNSIQKFLDSSRDERSVCGARSRCTRNTDTRRMPALCIAVMRRTNFANITWYVRVSLANFPFHFAHFCRARTSPPPIFYSFTLIWLNFWATIAAPARHHSDTINVHAISSTIYCKFS